MCVCVCVHSYIHILLYSPYNKTKAAQKISYKKSVVTVTFTVRLI